MDLAQDRVKMKGFGISGVGLLSSFTRQLITVCIIQINIEKSVTCRKITVLFQIWVAS
jgi:hypothetical protein